MAHVQRRIFFLEVERNSLTMIQLKPYPDNSFVCPECSTDQPIINEFRFESINIFADCACKKCGFEFYQVLPVGHTVDFRISIGKNSGAIYKSDKCPEWLSQSLLKSHKERRTTIVDVERIVYKKFDKVIILNTLDSLYGHVLLKLYNSFYHLDKQASVGLIIIIPKMFKWLIPSGCAEAWIVDLKLDELKYNYESFQRFVSKRFDDFQEIYLSNAYSHPSLGIHDIERLTGVNPFDLDKFADQELVITFVLRADRWWFNNKIDFWFYLVCRKLNILSWGNHILNERQNHLIRKTIKSVRKKIRGVKFFIVGLGEPEGFKTYARDHRHREVNSAIEKSWCKIYAQSHVVVGIHGSNMLLPTALAAGCVEILPEDRYGNIIQDISVRYSDRKQLFFYRFVDQFASADSVASKAIAILRDYEAYNINMCMNMYSYEPAMTSLP